MSVRRAEPIGVIAALPIEARAFGTRIPRGGTADLGGNIVISVCGVGAGHARRAAERLLARPLAGLVSWGTAGALSARLPPGACLLPTTVLARDAAYETHAGWRERIAERLSCEVHDEPLYSGGEIATAIAEKARLHEETGAIAVDVESGAIAELAARAHMPFLCARAVLDTADTALPALVTEGLGRAGYPELQLIVRSLMRGPAQLRSLPRLARQLRAARQTLRRIARDTGPRLLGP